jgi:hypothetical protein
LIEALLGYETSLLAFAHGVDELSTDDFRFLFSCLDSRMILSLVCSLELPPGDLA